MKYLGGKARVASWLADHVRKLRGTRDVLIEPFVGGGNSLVTLAPLFSHVAAGDVHHDLILLYRAVSDGWRPPDRVTPEDYATARSSEPSALRGFVGFATSFGGKWFGGYARDPKSARNYAKEGAVWFDKHRQVFQSTVFVHRSFEFWTPDSTCVVYCDPPYAGTTGYKHAIDHAYFWSVARRWATAGALVLVSEETAPSDWTCIAERTRLRSVDRTQGARASRPERLYTFSPGPK